MATNGQATDTANQQTEITMEFAIQRIYVKDLSFESPNSPQIFRSQWQPAVSLDINVQSNLLETNVYEVVLRLTVTVKSENTSAFIAEVEQAGIFTIQSERLPPQQLQQLLKSYCPNLLFPYAREAVSDLTTRGGFPPLYLAPVNFDALYEQHLQRAQATETEKQSGGETGTTN